MAHFADIETKTKLREYLLHENEKISGDLHL
jgi:hypothetical protein